MANLSNYDAFIVLISYLRVLNMGYHHAHVNVSGPNYYGDHLLLQRLYEDESGIAEIDGIMEKTKANFAEPVSFGRVLMHVQNLYDKYELEQTLDSADPDSMFTILLKIEKDLQAYLTTMINSIGENAVFGADTEGILNLIQDTADKHQTNIYLIQQRLG